MEDFAELSLDGLLLRYEERFVEWDAFHEFHEVVVDVCESGVVWRFWDQSSEVSPVSLNGPLS